MKTRAIRSARGAGPEPATDAASRNGSHRPADVGARTRRPLLAPWQEHLAKRALGADLSQPIDIPDVARVCRLSFSHFVRAFANTVGMPPYRWSLVLRIQRTKELLSSTNAPLAEIALDCGFFDQSHFTNTFVRNVGTTPGRWRQMASSNRPAPGNTRRK